MAVGCSLSIAYACAQGAELNDPGTSGPTLNGGSVPDGAAPGPAGGAGPTLPAGGSPGLGTGGAGTGGASGTGGTAPSSGGQPASDGGASDCPNANEKRCGGLCVPATVESGCGSTACDPCPTVTNGTALCTSGACDFACDSSFVRSGSACVPAGSTDGGPAGCMDGGASCGPAVVDFGYAPVTFDPAGLSPSATATATVLDCGESTFDTTSMTFGNWCGQVEPTPVTQSQSSGSDIVVVPLPSITIAAGATLRVTGSLPVVFAVFGDATVAGTIDASASGTDPGPGGNWSCGTSQGGDGAGDSARLTGASGGGGGGFGTAGGAGGIADTDGSDTAGGIAGTTRGAAELSPLMGGCAGGMAGGCSGTPGGGGGGAVQLSVAGALTLTGAVRANGGDGETPCGANDEGGGTGGGSGGGILLEAQTLDDGAGTTEANGGRGGANGSYAGIFNCGGKSGGPGSIDASSPGSDGNDCQGGSSGGGGGYGRVWAIQH